MGTNTPAQDNSEPISMLSVSNLFQSHTLDKDAKRAFALMQFTPFETQRIKQRCEEIESASADDILVIAVQLRRMRAWINSDSELANRFKLYLAYLGIETN